MGHIPMKIWFSPLLREQSPLLGDYNALMGDFETHFQSVDSETLAASRIRDLRQGRHSVAEYAASFRELACDLSWNDSALISQFRFGLHADVKNLLLTLTAPSTLSEAITAAIRCSNRLQELRKEGTFPSTSTSAWIPSTQPQASAHVPMQVDAIGVRPRLTLEEKERRRAQNLCLYCGGAGHRARGCPNKQENSRVRSQ